MEGYKMSNTFSDTAKIKVGDTISVPPVIHGLEKKSNAIGEVIGIYQHVAVIKQKNGVKFSIFRSDLDNYYKKNISIVSRTANKMVEEQSEDIMRNI